MDICLLFLALIAFVSFIITRSEGPVVIHNKQNGGHDAFTSLQHSLTPLGFIILVNIFILHTHFNCHYNHPNHLCLKQFAQCNCQCHLDYLMFLHHRLLRSMYSSALMLHTCWWSGPTVSRRVDSREPMLIFPGRQVKYGRQWVSVSLSLSDLLSRLWPLQTHASPARLIDKINW